MSENNIILKRIILLKENVHFLTEALQALEQKQRRTKIGGQITLT